MLRGESISLRTVRDADLDEMYEGHHSLSNRGDHFPLGVPSQPAFRKAFAEDGFWTKTEGTLLIVDADDQLFGHIEWFETTSYLDEIELSYLLYSPEHGGRGIATQAVRLLTAYLFDAKRYNRIRLVIHPDNLASKRVAEKSGYSFESVARGAWYHRGRSNDVEIWVMLRAEHPRADPGRPG